MPSIKSRESKFYYSHPKNRFWKIMSIIFEEEIIDREKFLLKNKIALWDVLKSCWIVGSNDNSIKNEEPNDIQLILDTCPIKVIFTTGKTAHKYYQKYFKDKIEIPEICLSSTSPANCRKKLDELLEEYKIIKNYL